MHLWHMVSGHSAFRILVHSCDYPVLLPFFWPNLCPVSHPPVLPVILLLSSYAVISPSFHLSVNSFIDQSMYPSIHPSHQPFINPTIYPSIQAFIHPPNQPPIYPSIYSFNYPSIHPSTYPSIQPPIHSPNHPFIHLTICPSIHPSIQPSNHSSIDLCTKRSKMVWPVTLLSWQPTWVYISLTCPASLAALYAIVLGALCLVVGEETWACGVNYTWLRSFCRMHSEELPSRHFAK